MGKVEKNYKTGHFFLRNQIPASSALNALNKMGMLEMLEALERQKCSYEYENLICTS